jgi:putative membrane protein
MVMFTSILVGFVALEHAGFLVLEMFLWTTPYGQKTFGLTPDFAQASAALAQNQGLYNGFLAAGLIWSFFIGDATWQFNVRAFFLVCVIVAGLFGGYTAKPSIYVVQALPAAIALALVWMTRA